jgi:hypothetical protein
MCSVKLILQVKINHLGGQISIEIAGVVTRATLSWAYSQYANLMRNASIKFALDARPAHGMPHVTPSHILLLAFRISHND